MSAPWTQVPIATIAHVARGGSPRPIKNFVTTDDDGINWIKIGDTEKGGRYIYSTKEKIRPEGIKRSRWVDEGDFLLSNSMSFGRPYILRISGCVHDGWLVLKPDYSRVDQDYLYYALSSPAAFRQFDSLAAGSTVRNLNIDIVSGVTIPLPPLEEQKRIVQVLDQAFAAFDRARTHAEANLADAEELFSASVMSVVQRYGKEGVRTLRLGSIVQRLTNGYVGPTRDIYIDEGIPYLLARHVRNNSLSFDGRTYVSHEFNEKNKKSKLKKNDVLLVQSGHIGHCAVVPDEHVGHNCHAMIVITPKDDVIYGPLLAALFSTSRMQEIFQSIRTGSTVPHLTCKMVKEVMLEVPPRENQGELVSKIDLLRQKCDGLIHKYSLEIESIADLRQSLLQNAFSGQLA